VTDSTYEILCSSCRAPTPSTAEVCLACGHSLRRHEVSLPVERLAAPAESPAPGVPAPVFIPALRADGSRRYGGFWVRLAALLVDGIVLDVPLLWLLRSFGSWALLGLIPAALYFPLMESSSAQATLGKIVFGLKVTDTGYRRISFRRALARHLAHIVSGLILYLGYVMVVFTPQKRALHDYIAGTVVLRV
jgi:uncharacterized RDD family membrane protein YckC